MTAITAVAPMYHHNVPNFWGIMMQFDNTLTETDLDPAAREFAKSLREQGVKPDVDYGVEGFEESLSSRLLRLIGIKKD